MVEPYTCEFMLIYQPPFNGNLDDISGYIQSILYKMHLRILHNW